MYILEEPNHLKLKHPGELSASKYNEYITFKNYS